MELAGERGGKKSGETDTKRRGVRGEEVGGDKENRGSEDGSSNR